MIVLNSLNDQGAGFQYNTNKITIIDKENNIIDYELKDKSEVAKDIIHKIIEKWIFKMDCCLGIVYRNNCCVG